ncbi:unnamed protein product, partial [Penicillium glandicola]
MPPPAGPRRPTPPPRQLAPNPPSARPAPPWAGTRHRWPPRPGAKGRGTACSVWLRGHRHAGGSYCEGHPARAPTVRSPAAPARLTQCTAAAVADPQSLTPGPSGPDRFYTNPPTPFG